MKGILFLLVLFTVLLTRITAQEITNINGDQLNITNCFGDRLVIVLINRSNCIGCTENLAKYLRGKHNFIVVSNVGDTSIGGLFDRRVYSSHIKNLFNKELLFSNELFNNINHTPSLILLDKKNISYRELHYEVLFDGVLLKAGVKKQLKQILY